MCVDGCEDVWCGGSGGQHKCGVGGWTRRLDLEGLESVSGTRPVFVSLGLF